MKKITLLFTLLLMAFTMNAQFTVEDADGALVSEGQVVTYGVAGTLDAYFDFFVNNPSTTDPVRMKIEFVSAVNADGSQMELCFGLCYTSIVLGNSYPPGADFIEIAPGGQTGLGNHFVNSALGNGTDILDYNFRFYAVAVDGTTPVGTPLNMSYRYDPSFLGVNDVNKLDVTLNATVVTDNLVVNVKEPLDLVVYDLNGRIISTHKLETGSQQVDMSSLNTQLYILKFSNNEGSTFTAKVIVK